MLNQKSVLARLLANENITVQQDNYETASFDVENRVLNLPMWRDMGRDVYDLLVGHEVAHALYTPEAEKLIEAQKEGIPHAYLNIIEDIRIEKMMLRTYPGLVGNFKRGYKDLAFVRNLFGIADKDVNGLRFMDRLNIKAKLRDLVNIEFSDEEKYYVDLALAANSWDDVLNACREIMAWQKDKAEEEGNDSANANADSGEGEENASVIPMPMPGKSGEGEEGEESEEAADGENSEGDDSEEKGEEGEDGEQSNEPANGSAGASADADGAEKENANKKVAGSGHGQNDPAEELEEGFTDRLFNENQEMLVEEKTTAFIVGMDRKAYENSLVSYKELFASRDEHYAELASYITFDEEAYKKFIADNKAIVNLMVKEFEMRKAAYRNARARTSDKGTLDVNKLHRYKFDDQIFNQVTRLGDAKNHGLIMLIDYSGSMGRALPSVLRQLITLVSFCKRVQIPFEVNAFTTMNGSDREAYTRANEIFSDGKPRFDSSRTKLVNLVSSNMSKRDYERAIRDLHFQIQEPHYGRSRKEDLGSTPLNASIMASKFMIDDFRAKHRIDKLSLITLTDGDSDGPQLNPDEAMTKRFGWSTPENLVIQIDNKIVKTTFGREARYTYNYGMRGGRAFTAQLVDFIRKEMGVSVINYFIGGRRDVKQEVYKSQVAWNPNVNEIFKAGRKEGVIILDDNFGYDRRFIMSIDKLSENVEELDIEQGMSAAKIAKAFNKANGSKKSSKVITQKFAEIVA